MGRMSKSAQVVGAHYFAKLGYDEAMRQLSANLVGKEEKKFWKEVIATVEAMQEIETSMVMSYPSEKTSAGVRSS